MNENNIQTISENKKKSNVGLVIVMIILIIILATMIYFVYILNQEITNLENDNKELKEQIEQTTKQNENYENNTTTVTQKTNEEIAKELYLDYIKNTSLQNEALKLDDYRVDNVEVITGVERQQIIDNDANSNEKYYQSASDKDIFAKIIYSVKIPNNNSVWTAGNGELSSDNWVVNKVAVVYIKYEDGNYKIQLNATDW